MRKIQEECGVFGIYSPNRHEDTAHDVYTGLYALQHRGQESAGITVNKNGALYSHKDMGLTGDVFNEMILNFLQGNIAIGHVMSAPSGYANRDNAQPIVMKYTKGDIAYAHNGNLINKDSLRESLKRDGCVFQSTSAAEVIAAAITRERLGTDSTEHAIINTMDSLHGAYSLLILTVNKLIAVRDPNGFRPLCMGKRGDSIIFASESCAIDAVGGEFIRDVQPGEVIVVSQDGIESHTDKCGRKRGSLCVFEHVYFARPDSIVDGLSVHFARQKLGEELAKAHPVDADIVCGVPDSGLDAALGYARASGIPYGVGLMKNRYIGRTFILPKQGQRENAVRLKLNPLSAAVRGKRVVLVDDSIVRGTTSAKLIDLMRDAGAKEVHLRISSPPFLFPCYFGTDINSTDKLIACKLSLEEIRKSIGADTLGYLPTEAIQKLAVSSNLPFCDACFTGNYPVEIDR